MKDRFKFTAESGVLEIFIYGRIGGSWWDDNAVSAASLAKLLQDHASVSTIKLRVNSLGGSVFEGAAIYNLLRRHNARKEVDIDGVAASAASWIVMAGDVRRIGVLGMFMIHEASGDTWGPAEEHEKTADLLRKMNAQQVEVYATRSKLKRADIEKKLAAETWFTAAEALAAGFVTETVQDTLADEEAAARRVALGGSIADHGFKNAPSAQLERFFSFAAESRRPRTPLELLGDLTAATAQPQQPTFARGESPSPAPEEKMNKKILAAVLAISESAADEAFEAAILDQGNRLKKLEGALGKSGDEAHGTLLAWKKTFDDAPSIKAELDTLKKTTADQELSTLIADGKATKKLTPALEAQVREQIASGDLSLKGAKAFVAALPVIAALVAAGDGATSATAPGATAAADGDEPKHNGKLFAEMSGPERAALKKSNPELYASMLAHSKRRFSGN